VARVGERLEADGAEVRDVSGLIVTPGLIDLHTHVYWGGTSLGIDAEDFARRSAVTTCVDTGSAGPGNFAGFRKGVIERSAVRILPYLHVSFAGIYASSKRIVVGEGHDIRLLAARDCIDVVKANRDLIVGIKVRIGRTASGAAGIVPLDVAEQVADQTGLPMMVHIDEPSPSYEEVIARLRPGDVLTHCFRPFQTRQSTARARSSGTTARRHLRHRPRDGRVQLEVSRPTRSRRTSTRCASTGLRTTRSPRCRNSWRSACGCAT
jgi:dihydroorotase